MKSFVLHALLLLSSLASTIGLTSCASNSGNAAGDGTYTPPPSLSPVEATDRMRSHYRDFR
ncbi:MAG: hypothetical protein JNJ70_11800 [Verrucomicrobiales bacterium]|nr:hypothetical protein [Verrucomicrobiales bacterium]